MIRFSNRVFMLFLLVIFVAFSLASCQDAKADTTAEISDEDTIDLSQPSDTSADDTKAVEEADDQTTKAEEEDDRGAGPVLGQSLLPPLPGLMPGPLNLFSSVFPALNSLLMWSNMFPMTSLLGQAPPSLLGQPQQTFAQLPQIDLTPSASKVVLVLAEDRNPHAAMKAANQEAARTIRQNDVISQLLAQFNQADLGQLLSQSLEPMQQQNPSQLLQQIVPPELSQSMNQMLSQMLQPLPGLDLSQVPLLGQALGQSSTAAEPTVGQALDESANDGASAAAAGTTADAPSSTSQTSPFASFQQAIDTGAQMLGQALQQQPGGGDGSSPFQLPNFQSAFDAGAQMLGQALQQANGDQPSGNIQLPNIQAVIDSGAQMLSQSGSLFNLAQLQSLAPAPAASDAEPAASDISEVRVKPDGVSTMPKHHDQHGMPTTTAQNMDQMQMNTALHKAFMQKKLPILWFRIPTDSKEMERETGMKHNADTKPKSIEELQLEAKLHAFQHQVIRELRLLQEIERKAKEMRATSKGATAKTYKDTHNYYSNNLSKLPVHKITHADIEKALADEYVRKLLHKAAFSNMKEMGKSAFPHLKRQTNQATSTSLLRPRQMSREDIIRLLAYAYRFANANGMRMFDTSGGTKPATATDAKSRTQGTMKDDKNAKPMERHMTPTQQNFMQNPTMMTDDKKMTDKMTPTMERQWSTDTNAPKQMPMPYEQNSKDTASMMPTGRQMSDKMNTQMPTEGPTQVQMKSEVAMQQEKSRQAMQQQMIQMQPRPVFNACGQIMGMRSWMEANPQMPMQQQQQQQQTNTQSESLPRQNMAAPPTTTANAQKWADEQSQKAMQQAQMMMQETPRNMQQQPTVNMQQKEMSMQQPATQMDTQQPRTHETQHTTSPTDMKQMHGPLFVGEATPQMPEHSEKARHKVDLDDLDWGDGWGGWGHGIWGLLDGGKKGKKHGYGGWPTVINYYYNPGYHRDGLHSGGYTGAPAPIGGYSSGTNYGSNYGTSYTGSTASQSSGYAAPSGSSYRVAVGDDEIREMLEEHAREKMMPDTDPNPTTAAFEPLTTIHQATETATTTITTKATKKPKDDNSERDVIELQKEAYEKISNPTTTKTPTIKTTNNDAPFSKTMSEMSRLDRKLRFNDIINVGKGVSGNWVRQKRSANYGTLQPIDSTSLEELRKTYKDSLKEITLKPDEDPAEALARYNAASIREALEAANQEALQVNTGEVSTNGVHYQSAQMPIVQQENARTPMSAQSNMYASDYQNERGTIREPIRKHQQQDQNSPQHYRPHSNVVDKKVDDSQSSQSSKYAALMSDETQSMIANLPESELQTVFNLIKEQMQACCDACRDRIISSIKSNIKNTFTREVHGDYTTTTRKENAFTSEPPTAEDEQFNKWLREMAAKGYDTKYLTKIHHWEYLNSGKLALAVESNEAEEGEKDNRIAKKSNGQSFKRYTETNTLANVDEQRTSRTKRVDIPHIKIKKVRGTAFTKKTPDLNTIAVKEQAHVVNDELSHLTGYTDESVVTPTPYAMRGKFKRTRKSHIDATSITTPVKFNALAEEPTTIGQDEARSGKVVELLSLLYDLNPKVESENGKPTQLSVMVMPIVATTTIPPPLENAASPSASASTNDNITISATTTNRTRIKRMRSRRKQKIEVTTQATA